MALLPDNMGTDESAGGRRNRGYLRWRRGGRVGLARATRPAPHPDQRVEIGGQVAIPVRLV